MQTFHFRNEFSNATKRKPIFSNEYCQPSIRLILFLSIYSIMAILTRPSLFVQQKTCSVFQLV